MPKTVTKKELEEKNAELTQELRDAQWSANHYQGIANDQFTIYATQAFTLTEQIFAEQATIVEQGIRIDNLSTLLTEGFTITKQNSEIIYEREAQINYLLNAFKTIAAYPGGGDIPQQIAEAVLSETVRVEVEEVE